MEFVGCVQLHSQYVPLPWLDNACHDFEAARRSGIYTAMGIRQLLQSPPPPYHEAIGLSELPGMAYDINNNSTIYAKVRRSSSKFLVLEDEDKPQTPSRSPSLSSNASILSSPSSEHSFSSDMSTSTTSSTFSSRTLRRSRKSSRGLDLRQLRAKESEAELRRAYSTTVDSYLTGEIFDNFRSWPEPIYEGS